MSENLKDIKTLGELLRHLCRSAGYHTDEEFTTALTRQGCIGIDIGTINRWFNDKYPPRKDHRRAILKVFHRHQMLVDLDDPNTKLFYSFLDKRNKISTKKQPDDCARRILEIFDVNDASEMASILTSLSYNHSSVHTLNKFINSTSSEKGRFHKYISEIVIHGEINKHLTAIAICANVLCIAEDWKPSEKLLDAFESKCNLFLKKGFMEEIGVSGNLSAALSRINRPYALEGIISNLVFDTHISNKDFEWLSDYYGGGTEHILLSLDDHFHNKGRKEILLAHDTHRFFEIYKSGKVSGRVIDTIVMPRLDDCISYLINNNLAKEAEYIIGKLEKKSIFSYKLSI